MMTTDLIDYTLPNGLHVMLKPIHTAPIVSSWAWYAVGSRNEVAGKTGLSHWVEHMQFKGTTQRSAQDMDHAVAKAGGMWNAFTSTDWTTYFETLPANKLDLALSIEADRMRNSLFDPLETETERTVIISEREGSENDPQFPLGEAVQAKCFKRHPYRNEVIGSKQDLLSLSREDLFGHYQNYYQPGNATLCIAGDIDPDTVREQVEVYFDGLASNPITRQIPVPEERLEGFEEVEQRGPGETTFIQISYRTPAANSADFFSYTILDSLLAGPSSLNMFGSGGIGNRTSRLYRALVEKQLAVSVYGGLNASIDPGTYTFNLTAHPRHGHKKLIKAFDKQIAQILDNPVTQEEIDRAVKQARALFAYGSDNITNQAFWMGYACSFADYDWFLDYVDRLARVTPEDLQRVARTYLNPDARVIGVYLPKA